MSVVDSVELINRSSPLLHVAVMCREMSYNGWDWWNFCLLCAAVQWKVMIIKSNNPPLFIVVVASFFTSSRPAKFSLIKKAKSLQAQLGSELYSLL